MVAIDTNKSVCLRFLNRVLHTDRPMVTLQWTRSTDGWDYCYYYYYYYYCCCCF
jgi:hypothetical protein